MRSTLYIVSTPIGNLGDISYRAVETLKGVDLILCEDTRVTQRLLVSYQIKKPLLSYHQHSKIKKNDYILELLREGKNLALVSDAGTPGISDPGGRLISEVFGSGFKVVPVPGPSAVTAAASISGLPMEKFLFLGFPPNKKKRKKFFEEAIHSKYPVIFYESPYRILKALKELNLEAKTYNLNPKIVVCRELTKKFETIYRGTIEEVVKEIERDKARGEFVIILEGKKQR